MTRLDVGAVPPALVWKRVASGLYESEDGRVVLQQVPGVYPPAWNVEWTIDYGNALAAIDPDYSLDALALTLIVDGARSFRDAKLLAADAWPAVRDRIAAIEASAASVS